MCGRYAFDDIKEIFEVRGFLEEAAVNVGNVKASQIKTGEVFPSETAAVLAEGLGPCAMLWGYPLSGAKSLIINARSETLLQKSMFRKSIADKKCLIPCTGFYEWKTAGSRKQKYRIRLKNESFFFLAGLYDTFGTQDQKEDRFVIITVPANEAMTDIHQRMPLIVPKADTDSWLRSTVFDIEGLSRKVKELDIQAV